METELQLAVIYNTVQTCAMMKFLDASCVSRAAATEGSSRQLVMHKSCLHLDWEDRKLLN